MIAVLQTSDLECRLTEPELEPTALAPAVREETPSQPTGVRIDQNKVLMVHNEMVRVTEGFTVEKLERTYAILAKVMEQLISVTTDSLDSFVI